MSSNFTVNKVCEHCGNIFSAKTTVTRFCSHRCNSRNYKQKLREEKITVSNQAVRQVIGHKLEELTNLEFLSVKAAAKLLGASDKIVHTMIKSGRLKTTNLSQTLGIPPLSRHQLGPERLSNRRTWHPRRPLPTPLEQRRQHDPLRTRQQCPWQLPRRQNLNRIWLGIQGKFLRNRREEAISQTHR